MDCQTAVDSIHCGQFWQRNDCEQFINVPTECPNMCGLCPLADFRNQRENVTSVAVTTVVGNNIGTQRQPTVPAGVNTFTPSSAPTSPAAAPVTPPAPSINTQAVHTNTQAVHTNTQAVPTNTQAVHTNTQAVHTNTQSVHTNTQAVPTNTQAVHTNTQSVHTNTQAVHINTQAVPTNTQAVPNSPPRAANTGRTTVQQGPSLNSIITTAHTPSAHTPTPVAATPSLAGNNSSVVITVPNAGSNGATAPSNSTSGKALDIKIEQKGGKTMISIPNKKVQGTEGAVRVPQQPTSGGYSTLVLILRLV